MGRIRQFLFNFSEEFKTIPFEIFRPLIAAQIYNIEETHMVGIIFQNANLTVNGTKTRRFDANFPEVMFLNSWGSDQFSVGAKVGMNYEFLFWI